MGRRLSKKAGLIQTDEKEKSEDILGKGDRKRMNRTSKESERSIKATQGNIGS